MLYTVHGVDPGLVHTGLVRLRFATRGSVIEVSHVVIDGPNHEAVAREIEGHNTAHQHRVFIEGYQARSHFGSDVRMQKAVNEMKAAVPGSKVLLNTGVKRVVRQPLMELLGCWQFGTPTHHQDLRSAARIALLGMLKDEELNGLIANVVRDHVDGKTWSVSAS